ncbi:MAG: hypothetical protein E7666_06335 [Ruminococcaceae bacterium]|nr:hypothetical protein [Oscillospiraceae bacterium]
MMRKILCCLVSIITLFAVCSCGQNRIGFEDVKNEFAQYSPTNDVVCIVDEQCVFFGDHEVDLEDIMKGDYNSVHASVLNDKIYYAVNQRQKGTWYFMIYQCDLYGEQNELLFKRELSDVHVKVTRHEAILFIRYKENGEQKIDKYDILTSTYEESVEDEFAKYSPETKYLVKGKDNAFLLTDPKTNKTCVIDEAYLRETPYYESMRKFDYRSSYHYSTNGNLFLIYRMEATEYFFDIPKGYTFVIFEYDFDQEELIFKTVVFPYDFVNFKIEENLHY